MAGPPAEGGASSIQVTVRVRPFTIREAAQLVRTDDNPLFLGDGSLAAVPTPLLKAKGIRPVIKVVDEKCLVFDPPEDNPVQRFSRSVVPSGKRVKDQTFGFDKVFDENTTQGDVYESTTKNLLDSVCDGYNATVFAYGATGCGKTHTITGTSQQPGIIFLTMQELFEKVEELKADKDSEITLSYLEIYNETIRDLLNPGTGGKQGLMLREDANQAVSVAGLSSHNPQNVQEVMDMVIRGNGNRTQSPTEANATSSRSHAVLQVNVSLKSRDASVHEPVTMATLSIIDLAGSERASATKNRGERLLEGANINKSLLSLGSCINALCDPRKKNHVPYRNSKLTRLLKFSLGGNCRTVMIVCVSPSSQHFDETQNTLRYANRAKNIQTKSVRNVYNVDRHVKDYLKKIDEQMNRINELTSQQKQHEELAFAKFRKAEVKRAEVAHEGVQRIRAAFDHSANERQDRVNNMRRLRQIERRIGAISGWIGAFDQICETREDEEPPRSLIGMRKTAQGILVELEGSRQHYHQRMGRNNWCRAIDTALQDGLRQLQGLDGAVPGSIEEASLKQELESLKCKADLEAHIAVLDLEKSSEQGLMQVLLTAHFETITILNQILQMSEEEALQAARDVLGKLLQSCTESVGQVIKPDGGLQITEAVPPSKAGTPRKRKQVPLMGPSPLKSKTRPSFSASQQPAPTALPVHMAPHIPSDSSSPASASRASASPRRRVKLPSARKGVVMTTPSATGKKKYSSKKRAVRWRDEGEDGVDPLPLVEFQPTPKGVCDSSPIPPPDLPQGVDRGEGSSPLPERPVPKMPSARFATGFLTKREGAVGSPPPPTLTTLPGSSDEEATSPLRERAANSAPHRSSQLRNTTTKSSSDSDHASSDSERPFPTDRETEVKIRDALNGKLKRTSSARMSRNRASDAHRRRSPTATSTSPPPSANPNSSVQPNSTSNPGSGQDGIFSASHARRMVRSERDSSDNHARSVLSPRTAPVVKGGGRRSAVGGGGGGGGEGGAGQGGMRHVRVGSLAAAGMNGVGSGGVRVSSGSGGAGGKAVWR